MITYRKGSVIGTNMLHFMKAVLDIIKLFKSYGYFDFAELFEALMKNIIILCFYYCQIHDDKKYNSNDLEKLKIASKAFYKIFPKYIKKCAVTPGIKVHQLPHLYSWTSHHKRSPESVGDQRIEGEHPWIRKIWNMYTRFGVEKQLEYVVSYLNNRTLLNA
eukprot:213435_1